MWQQVARYGAEEETANELTVPSLSEEKVLSSVCPGTGRQLNMAALSAWFWNERFWLPHNVTWADLADPAPGVEYPKAGHLLAALPLALGIFTVRILFERFVFENHVVWGFSCW